jgi:hypothetical protein
VQSTGPSAQHFVILKEACIPSLKSIRLKVTELCSGQALGDADADNVIPICRLFKAILNILYGKIHILAYIHHVQKGKNRILKDLLKQQN